MAIVHNPALSSAASGCVGDINYTTFRGRAVARSRWTGVQTSTADQLTQRGYLTSISQAWGSTLTAAQRTKWKELASVTIIRDRFGVPRNPNGYNLFVRRNMNRLSRGYTAMIFVPEEITIVALKDLILTYQGSYPRCQVYLRTGIDGEAFDGYDVWRAGPYTSPGYTAQESDYRLVGWKKTTGAYNDYGISPAFYYWYKCRFFSQYGEVGNFIAGQKYMS